MSASDVFGWEEYMVFGAVLAVSLLVGVFFGFVGGKNKTNEEFLMAGRSMGILPVTLSLVCSFVSAILMLGTPLEVYNYGVQQYTLMLGFIPMTLALIFLYVPVYFNLQLTSAYEYFEWRFNKKVRKIISISAIIHLLLYMPTTVYGPALALDQVSGMNRFMTSAAIFIVCIIYSSIGGLKAVLWTDAFQAIIMLGSIITVIIFGMIEIDGSEYMWDVAKLTGRDTFFELDGDPRRRFTLWVGFANYFNWITLFGATQAQIQRYNSVATLRKAQICLLLNMLGLMVFVFFLSLAGLVMFAYYFGCDPIESKRVDAPDQMLPSFVIDIMGHINGLPGLFVAGITAGSLSSVSSALNALPGIIIEDFVKDLRPQWGEKQLVIASKVISAGSGIIAFALVFVIASAGDILPFVTLLHGAFIGPIFALFSLGLFFPFANSIGSALAMAIGVIVTLFIGIGSVVAGNEGKLPNQKRFLTTDFCPENGTDYIFKPLNLTDFDLGSVPYDNWKEESKDDSGIIKLFSISYIWQPFITVVSIIILGILFSWIVNLVKGGKGRTLIRKKYLSGPVLWFWNLILGKSFMSKWVDFSDEPLKRIETLESYFTDPKVFQNPPQNPHKKESPSTERKLSYANQANYGSINEPASEPEVEITRKLSSEDESEPEITQEPEVSEPEIEDLDQFTEDLKPEEEVARPNKREIPGRLSNIEPMDLLIMELKLKQNKDDDE